MDEIVEICIVDGKGTVLLNTLVKPQGTMNPDAAAKSGITDTLLATCEPFSAIAGQVRAHLQAKDVVIYNADYDEPRITAAFSVCGQMPPAYVARCAMEAYQTFMGHRRWVKLIEACQEAGIRPQRDAHRALADCLSTLALLRRMADYAPGPAMRPVGVS